MSDGLPRMELSIQDTTIPAKTAPEFFPKPSKMPYNTSNLKKNDQNGQ